MAKVRDNYQISATTVQELVNSLNFLLQRIADRLDKIEGIRGAAAIEGSVSVSHGDSDAAAVIVSDSDAVTIHSME